jgi:DNA-binding MltR family transcriptional regulator
VLLFLKGRQLVARKAIRLDDGAPDKIYQFFGDFAKAVVEGSSLACALIATSVVENALMTLLVTLFVKGNTTDGLFKSGGPLGDWFRCTQMAYSIGLIREPVKQNLERVGEIRNTFAHSRKLIEFEDATIVALCSKLTLPKGRDANTLTHNAKHPLSRMQFTYVCGYLRIYLVAYAALYADPLAAYRDQLPRPPATEW